MKYQFLPELKNVYNVAVWKGDSGCIYLLGRYVTKRTPQGEPDWGDLVLVKLDGDLQVVDKRTVWQPQDKEVNLEDTRALKIDGKLAVGLTAVVKDGSDGYLPYPAYCLLDNGDYFSELPAVNIIKSLGPGKNITPLNSEWWMFRSNFNNHALVVFKINKNRPIASRIVNLNIVPKWASLRIGTTMPPIWLNRGQTRALLILHGIQIRGGKFYYSLGRAQLSWDRKENKFGIEVVDRDPFLTPDYFRDRRGKLLYQELYNFRRVIYLCGGVILEKKLLLFINLGDTTTAVATYELDEFLDPLI